MTASFLEIRNLKVQFAPASRPIFDHFSLHIGQGDFVILLGPNGSGKSTLLKLLCGMIPVTEGALLFQNVSVSSKQMARMASSVSILTQDPAQSTFGSLTIEENIELAFTKNRGFVQSHDRTKKGIPDLPAALQSKLKSQVKNLSGGERQLLALFLCLLHPPKLLLLDEHTSALDPIARIEVMKRTAEAVAEHGITTLMTTHDLDDALQYGNRVVVMNQGKLVADFQGQEKQALTKDGLLKLYEGTFR